MLTEQRNPKTMALDELSTAEILQVMNEEDQSVPQLIRQALPQIEQAIDAIVERMERGGRLIYSGAGTSGRLGVLDAVECMPTFSIPPERVIGLMAGGERAFVRSIEGAEDRPELGRADLEAIQLSADDVVVGIAASGRTPYVLGALAYAQERGARTIAISCNVPAPILDAAEIAIGIPVGPEVLTGSTRLKSGTAQKLVLNMISTTTMIRIGKVYGNLMVDVQVSNEKLAGRARGIVMQVTDLDADAAQQMLEQAHDSVKVAIVMYKRSVSYEQALELLHDAGGHLRKVIG
jgi:N-acetylmuramic acid 6-phosphate etherase